MQTAFIAAVALAGGYFLFARRRFDFAAIAYGGVIFYFLPLFFGDVMLLRSGQNVAIVPAVYWLACGLLLAIAAVGVASDRLRERDPRPGALIPDTAFLWVGVVAFFAAIIASGGKVFDFDKTQTLKQVGYWYLLFEVCASLGTIGAVARQNWQAATVGATLLLIDVAIGFRAYATLSFLACCVVSLCHQRTRLILKAPTLGAAALAVALALLFAHSIRYQVASAFAVEAPSPSQPYVAPPLDTNDPDYDPRRSDTVRGSNWLKEIPRLVRKSEPFLTQSILNEAMRRDLTCSPWGGLRALVTLLPPMSARLLGVTVVNFEDEFKPALFPSIGYGLAGNTWAEMLCRYGWAGVAIFAALFAGALFGFALALHTAPAWAVAPIGLGGVLVAFYVHRNDLQVTLGMLRHIAIATAIVWAISALLSGASQRWLSSRS